MGTCCGRSLRKGVTARQKTRTRVSYAPPAVNFNLGVGRSADGRREFSKWLLQGSTDDPAPVPTRAASQSTRAAIAKATTSPDRRIAFRLTRRKRGVDSNLWFRDSRHASQNRPFRD